MPLWRTLIKYEQFYHIVDNNKISFYIHVELTYINSHFVFIFQSSTSGLFYKFHQSNGVSFNISSDLANRMVLKNLIKTLEPKGAEHFVIAMAAGKHQFEESIPAIVSIHRHLPKYSIYYYDLGLASEQAKEV